MIHTLGQGIIFLLGKKTVVIQRIQVRDTNCYLLRGERGIVLLDPGPPGGAELVISGAKAAGVGPADIHLILVTHGHLDHYGAAAQVKAWCGAPLAAHRTAPAFSRDRHHALPPAQTLRGSVIRWFYLRLAPLVHFGPLEADLLLDNGVGLSPYGVDAQVVEIPGHADGSVALLTGEGDAFVGDLFVNYTVPSQPIYLSDRHAWQSSYQRIRSLEPRTVYVGHGEPFPGRQLDHIFPARYQFRWWVR